MSFVLHAHLPYVIHHGTWPHGMEWLSEVAAETYLPLLRMLRRLESDGVRFHADLVLSPVLLEQLAHPTFLTEFPRYLTRKIVAAREDEAFFLQSGEAHYAELARMWQARYSEAMDDFAALGGDLLASLRHFRDSGMLELLTSCATHSYLPLLGTDESVRAQVQLAVAVHKRHLGEAPRGIWSPECGYRPAGLWSYPVEAADGSPTPPAFERVGLEEIFAEAGLTFFYVDGHTIETARDVAPDAEGDQIGPSGSERSLYRPYLLAGASDRPSSVAAFPRDPVTGRQVWSSANGYPAEPAYLDFHKKRFPGGHRYWRVTDAHSGLEQKESYDPATAGARVRSHAAHFAHLLWQTLSPRFADGQPAVLTAPFDAELFGHWWFEGPAWLEAVARTLHEHQVGVHMTGSADYLETFGTAGVLALEEGSWGAGGDHRVWLNGETAWTWSYLYPAERLLRELATAGEWHETALGRRVVSQMCRELLLLESSDWQSLITTGAARDYAESRFLTHHEQFRLLHALWGELNSSGGLTAEREAELAEVEERDAIFPDLDPEMWATRTSPRDAPPVVEQRDGSHPPASPSI